MPLWDVTAGNATTEGSPSRHWQYLSCIYYTLTRKFTNLGASTIIFTFFTFFHIFTPAWRAKQWLEPRKTCCPLKHTQLWGAISWGSRPTQAVPALISSPNQLKVPAGSPSRPPGAGRKGHSKG